MSLAQIRTPWMGVAAVQAAFTKMGWFFREQTVSDFGIDAQVEIVEGDKPVGREALVTLPPLRRYVCRQELSLRYAANFRKTLLERRESGGRAFLSVVC
jgi:hypothetical protein